MNKLRTRASFLDTAIAYLNWALNPTSDVPLRRLATPASYPDEYGCPEVIVRKEVVHIAELKEIIKKQKEDIFMLCQKLREVDELV